MSARRWLLCVPPLALWLGGCAQIAPPDANFRGPVDPARVRRESDMNGQWQNQRMADLEASLGKPVLVMMIPGGGSPPGFAAVYGVDPKTGCIDAFALSFGEHPTVRVYHCR